MYIDSHVHCREGKQAYKETISHVLESPAEKVGVDAVFDMPNTSPPITRREHVLQRFELATSVDFPLFYGLYVGLTANPEQIREAVEIYNEFFPKCEGRFGVIGLKIFAGESVGDLAIKREEDQARVYRVLGEERYHGVLTVHCEKESEMRHDLWNPEDPKSHCRARPSKAEMISIQDQVGFAINTGFSGKLHIAHVSTPESVDYISEVKRNIVSSPDYYLDISCEATSHHLFLNEEMIRGIEGINYSNLFFIILLS